MVAANDMAFLDRLWQDWSPGYDAMEDLELANQYLREPPQPVLYLHGDRDGCIDVSLTADAAAHLSPDSRVHIVRDVGHFLEWITA